jgi:hypothetical protein
MSGRLMRQNDWAPLTTLRLRSLHCDLLAPSSDRPGNPARLSSTAGPTNALIATAQATDIDSSPATAAVTKHR